MATLLRSQVIPLAGYATGQRTFGPINILDAATSFYFECQRCTSADPTIWPNETTGLNLDAEISLDGGTTWIPAGGFGAVGGIFVLRSGQESALTTFETPLQPGTGRKLRVTITVTNGPLRTSGTAELRG